MMYKALQLMLTSVQQCGSWFIDILAETSGYYTWLTALMVALSYKFLLAPIFGQASSDMAKKSYNAFKRRKGDK